MSNPINLNDLIENSSNQANQNTALYDDRYKSKCSAVQRLIKEMIFYNGALDKKLKANYEDIAKLKIQREYLVSRLIEYERLDLNVFKNDEISHVNLNENKSVKKSSKKRVRSTADKDSNLNKVNKRIQFEVENVQDELIEVKRDLIDENGMKVDSTGFNNKTMKPFNLNKFDTISTLNVGHSNIMTSFPLSSKHPPGSILIGHQQISNEKKIVPANIIINKTVLPVTKASTQTSTNLISNVINSHSLNTNLSVDPSLNNFSSNTLSPPRLSTTSSTKNLLDNLSNNLSNTNSFNNMSNNILSNKNDVQVFINNHSLANNQYLIKPIQLNDKNLILNKINKNLTVQNESDENENAHVFYLDSEAVQSYVNDTKSNLINLNDLDKNNGKTLSFSLIV